MDEAPTSPALVLIVDHADESARSVESILKPKGHTVLRARGGTEALDLTERLSPDVILAERFPPDMDGIDLLQELRRRETIQSTTPLIVMTTKRLGRTDRLAVFGAGAWDILPHPIDPSELILKIDNLVRAKQETDRFRDRCLTDARTGLYNIRGILRRAKEVGADAVRKGSPMTCVAFGLSRAEDGIVPGSTLTETVADVLKRVTRASDAVGMLGAGEFVVVAPDTGQEGGTRLADRVFEALLPEEGRPDQEREPSDVTALRAGLYASPADQEAPTPEDLLLRATLALREAQSNTNSRMRSYKA